MAPCACHFVRSSFHTGPAVFLLTAFYASSALNHTQRLHPHDDRRCPLELATSLSCADAPLRTSHIPYYGYPALSGSSPVSASVHRNHRTFFPVTCRYSTNTCFFHQSNRELFPVLVQILSAYALTPKLSTLLASTCTSIVKGKQLDLGHVYPSILSRQCLRDYSFKC